MEPSDKSKPMVSTAITKWLRRYETSVCGHVPIKLYALQNLHMAVFSCVQNSIILIVLNHLKVYKPLLARKPC